MKTEYRGRFAPSPTGPLHFGSLVAAAASFLDARSAGGSWLVRMEDLDRDRTVPGASDSILSDLESFGFTWDGPVMYQSGRSDTYQEAFSVLQSHDLIYPCACSRKEIADSLSPAGESTGQRYPGTCSNGMEAGRSPRAWRIRVSGSVDFEDRLYGRQHQDLVASVGDFVLKRADGSFAYQLAVVVDDAAQGITDVVRGADLLDSTPRQIYLQHLLDIPTPRYLHIPVATDAAGFKLSKQTQVLALDRQRLGPLLYSALAFLGHVPPDELRLAAVNEIWNWAIPAWSPQKLPPIHARAV